MNQTQANTLVRQIQFIVQKTRSNMQEALAGYKAPNQIEQSVLSDLNPGLFPHDEDDPMGLVKVTSAYANKENIEPMDLYNLIFLLDSKAPSIRAVASFAWGIDLPEQCDVLAYVSKGWDE